MAGRRNFFGPAGALTSPPGPFTLQSVVLSAVDTNIARATITFDRPYMWSEPSFAGFQFAAEPPPTGTLFPHVGYHRLSSNVLQIDFDWAADPMVGDMKMTYDPTYATQPFRAVDGAALEPIPWHGIGMP